jgi:hypothetical protein
MGLVHVVFLERSLVEKHFQPFACGQLALGVLRVYPLSGRRQAGPVRAAAQPLR